MISETGLIPIPPVMPEAVREVFEPIKDLVVQVHGKWKFYRQLFDGPPEDRELLKLADLAFEFIHEALVTDVILAMGRLTDTPGEGQRENLSLGRLAMALESAGATELGAATRRHEAVAKDRFHSFRVHRNKRIAHTDRASHQGGFLQTLPPITKMMVNEALEAIRDCANEVELHYRLGRYPYQDIKLIGAGDDLLVQLRRARAYTQRVTRGEINPREDDLWGRRDKAV